ncbi:hypothetical protein [Actinokineospora sp. NBRC 105648]|uniref:hypothetical protein n=1 Tax=Actinokineospora sp. NBRC 105648 TaxID=3032206 RepID=UPI0024A0E2CE|nr:hypothetical protein [Actinokineospora sp. NBRC 105648]GLZ38209.1 hypothetical protein Acsp05_18330 [Actinokineospora sp. NBRC 105648]
MTTSGPGPQSNEPYERMPAAPQVNHPPAPARPKSVDLAFNLWLASAILGVVGFVLVLVLGKDAMREAARKSLQQSNTAFTPSQLDTAVNASLIFAGVIAVLSFGLFLLFAFKMRAGRNWARLTLAILGLLYVLLNVLGVVGGDQAVLDTVVGIVQILLVVGAIYYMFTKEAKAYFEAPRAQY